ncbi:MAG: hypothetical protein IID41_16255 [Planctomycetes bacterium]|nr:hypothetical protein [Planctomycetota bacterium]
MAGTIVDRVPFLSRILSNGRVRESDPSEFQVPQLSKMLLLGGVVGCVLGGPLLAALVPYDRSNFQWTLGAELQAVAAVFALAITGTLIAAQIAQSTTPRIVPFLAPFTFFLVVAFVVVTLAADVLTLMALPEDTPSYWIRSAICTVVASNVAAVLLVVAYARLIMARMQPEAYLAALRNQVRAGAKRHDFSQQTQAIHAIEELGQYSCGQRHVQTCINVGEYLAAVGVELVDVLEKDDEAQLALGQNTIELTIKIYGRLGAAYAEAGIDDAVYPIAEHMANIAAALCKKDVSRLSLKFRAATEDILYACGLHKREWAAYNLLGEKLQQIPLLVEQGAEEVIGDWVDGMKEEMAFCVRWNFINVFQPICLQIEAVIDLFAEEKLKDQLPWRATLKIRLKEMTAQLDASSIAGMTPRYDERTARKILDDLNTKFASVMAGAQSRESRLSTQFRQALQARHLSGSTPEEEDAP